MTPHTLDEAAMTRPAPKLRPGETPLTAFVSSVMTPELQWARDAVVEALDAVPFTVPWAFEYSPASTEDVVPGYLRKVRESDFVVWLAGEDITRPVADELAEALAADVPVVALLLAASSRSTELQETLARLRPHTRYRELRSDDSAELRSELEHAIGDEIVRALRNKPSMGRLARVEELGRASRARIVDKLQAAGVPVAQAIAIASDVTVTPTAPDGRPSAARPLVVLSSPVGAGKSLFGERAHQADIERYLTEAAAPVPVWLAATGLHDLQSAVLAASDGLGDPRQLGAAVVVDGADEAGPGAAARILSQARVLVRTWPSTTVLLSTRPMPRIGDDDEIAHVRGLTGGEAHDLVGRIAGTEITIGRAAGFAAPIRDALRRPLFALLLGSAMRTSGDVPQSRASLVALLVEHAAVPAESQPILRRLAVASLARGGGPVPTAEVASPTEAADLLATRLVIERDGGLVFPLIIFAQWFAAAAVAEGEVALDEIAADPTRIDDWLYPFAICVARYRPEQVQHLLETLARQVPGFASRVVQEATARWAITDVPAPPSLQAARAIRDATAAWVDGVGPLAEFVAPLRDDGSLAPLGARASGESLTVFWYWGPEEHDDVFELPADFSIFEPGFGWGPGKMARPGAQAGWPWRWSLENLTGQLQRVLKERLLPVRDTPLFAPALYQLVAALNNHRSLTAEEFDITATQARVTPDADITFDTNGMPLPVTGLHQDLQDLLDRGETVLRSPFPGYDQDRGGGGWVWDPYSPQRLLERTVAVYQTALDAFTYYVDRYFPTLASRMAIATTLPAVLRGDVSAPTGPGDEGGATIRWHLEALPHGECSRVELELSDKRSFWSDDDDEDAYEHLKRLRPEAASWLHQVAWGSVLDVFSIHDAAELAYGWLWSDLKAINWVDGNFPSRGYSRDMLAIR